MSSFSGYDLEFLSEPPEALKCLICLTVAREPWQHVICGKLFCKDCLEKHKKENDQVCPHCRDEDTRYFPDAKSNREVLDLQIKCENGRLGCDWTGELRAIKKHCGYIMVSCTNKCLTSDGQEYKCFRKDLDEHLKGEKCPKRSFKCPHCQEEGTYEERTTTHLETCPEVPTKCPNEGCDAELPAKDINNHVEVDCALTPKECKYRNIGCTFIAMQKDLETHQGNDQLHLQFAMETVVRQQMKLTSKTFKLTNYQKRKDQNEKIQFPSFYTSTNGYNMCLEVEPNGFDSGKGTHISVSALVIKGNNDHQLNWPFIGIVTFELLNQLADENHYAMKMEFQGDKNQRNDGTGWGYTKFIPHSMLSCDTVQYLKDDTLYFRVAVEIPDHKPWLEYTAAK